MSDYIDKLEGTKYTNIYHIEFLDKLKKEGKVDMFTAHAHLGKEFTNLTKEQCHHIVRFWAQAEENRNEYESMKKEILGE